MSLAPQHIETLEKAGGLILEQLVAAQAISQEQQAQILEQQRQIEQDTGEKPFVGQLLEQNGIDTSAVKQPLLDLQATARTLLHAHGESAAAQRCEGPHGAINLRDGVPDNKWTLADIESGDPAREQTALLQTRLLQTKVLATAANTLEANGQEIPSSTLTALRASQDAAREGFGVAIQALRQAGQSPKALEAVHFGLPDPLPAVNQQEIHAGIADAVEQLQQTGILSAEQTGRLLAQEAQRSANIGVLQARRQARSEVAQIQRTAEKPQQEGAHAQAVRNERNQQGKGGHSI